MSFRAIVVLAFLAAAAPGHAAELFTIDNAHSSLEFATRLAGFNRVKGRFTDYSGHVYFDEQHPTASHISFAITVNSINTDEAERDEHLKTADFFDAAKFPRITFDSSGISAVGPAGYSVRGTLTMKGVARQVVIPLDLITAPAVDPFHNRRFAVGGRFTIARKDFGINGPEFWGAAISNDVEIEFEFGVRRWNYESLSWSSKGKSAGKWFYEEAGAKGMDAAIAGLRTLFASTPRQGSEWNLRPVEFIKAAGRLADQGRHADAARLLRTVVDSEPNDTPPEAVAELRVQLAEELIPTDQAAAKTEIEHALAASPHATDARAIGAALHVPLGT